MVAHVLNFLDWVVGTRHAEPQRRNRARLVAVTGMLLALTAGIYLTVWFAFLENASPLSMGMLLVTFVGSIWSLTILRAWDNIALAAFVLVCAVIANLAVSSLVQGGFERLQVIGMTLTPLFVAYIGGVRWSVATASVVFAAESILFVLQINGIEMERVVGDDLMAMDALGQGLIGSMFVVVFSAFYVNSIMNSAITDGALQGQYEEVRSRMKMKADFVSVLGHELETPLRRIQRRLKRSRPTLVALADERQTSNMNMLVESTNHLRTIIGDLLDLERIEAGTITRSDFSIQVGKLVHDVINSHQPAAHKKSLHLTGEVITKQRLVSDPVRVRQILDNLVTNAIKYSDSGTITVRVYENNDGINFDVIDQGIGISKDSIQHVFEPMYQVDQSRTRRVDGVGLGLYIVKQLVHLLGGRMRVRSKVAKGTTFTLSFPPRMIDPRA